TGYGLTAAREIADELTRAGAVIVSGLAVGIDGEAHAACLDAGGQTAAVLPSPIDAVYPPRHRALAERIVAAGGALLSELPPGRVVGRPDFARRNRIIAGLARATVVVEAPDGSGALLTAAAALEYGRELFAVPGQIDSVASRGCNRLVADQSATIVTSAVALTHQLGITPGGRPISVATLSEAEAIVLAALFRRSASIEELIDRTRLRTSVVAGALTLLEARRLATSYGGATFHVTLDARRLERNGRCR
ncbi:MAG: DNA-protecting protein DprA, partial [Chloroflexota bacterium]|nr:DNA-protecting protein DprA [Chloroflexota bacterium]